jgi:tetraacyldisaccharide 4'-kinase
MARRVPAAIVVVHPNRIAACDKAVALGADVLILDDGLQHVRVRRDLDLVLLDARAPLGNGRFLPAGPLRDVPRAAQSAGAIVLTRADLASQAQRDQAHQTASRIAPAARVFEARHVLSGFYDVVTPDDTVQDLTGVGVHVLSAIARPADFVRALSTHGATVTGLSAHRDHPAVTMAEVRAACHSAATEGAACVVVTEKDAVRLPVGQWPCPIRVARMDFVTSTAAKDFIVDRLLVTHRGLRVGA